MSSDSSEPFMSNIWNSMNFWFQMLRYINIWLSWSLNERRQFYYGASIWQLWPTNLTCRTYEILSTNDFMMFSFIPKKFVVIKWNKTYFTTAQVFYNTMDSSVTPKLVWITIGFTTNNDIFVNNLFVVKNLIVIYW